MKKVFVGALAAVIVLLGLVVGFRLLVRDVDPAPIAPIPTPSRTSSESHPTPEDHRGFLYGRVTAVDGEVYQGRLRWGIDEEAFWGDAFSGFKDVNPWTAHVPKGRSRFEIFGVEVFNREREVDVRRPFMARFGDLARIERDGGVGRVTLKSGMVLEVDLTSASDFGDDVRVWTDRGVVDLDHRQVLAVEFFPTPSLEVAPYRLHGTVQTSHGELTGFVQWDREKAVGSDELGGVRLDTVRSIARRPPHDALVRLLDGRRLVLSDVGRDFRAIAVEDPRYGQVKVSWEVFERVDLDVGGSGPGYDDFPAGSPLTGSVTTLEGRRLTGRLVFDLDESETTETLDAPSEGLNYSIPFGLIASIVRPGRVVLHHGEELRLEASGDLGEDNAGMLIFVEDASSAEYVPWADVERIDFDRPKAVYPPFPES